MARRHQRIPDFSPGSTYGNLKDRFKKIEYQVGPYTDVDPNIDKHVAFSGGCEDAKILK